MRKQQIHPVKSDRYISLMVTSNTAGAGRFIRIPKLIFPMFACLLIAIAAVIAYFVTGFNASFESLANDLASVNNKVDALEAEKASTEALLSEKEELISDLLASLEESKVQLKEKENQLTELVSQTEDMWNKIENLESIKDSIYNKLNEAPADIYPSTEAVTEDIGSETGEPTAQQQSYSDNDVALAYNSEDNFDVTADIVPRDIDVSMASLEAAGFSLSKASADSIPTASSQTTDNFSVLYDELLSRFSALEDSINENRSELSTLSDMTDAYIPYINSIPSGYPIKDSHITCEYGARIDPVTGRRNAFHYGLDFSAAYRQEIYTTAAGTVTFAGYSTDFGYNIIIDHGYGYSTRYAHLSKLYVKSGDTVEDGELIGGAGSTGKSTAVHLHYEVIYNDSRIDPIDFLE